MNHSVLGIDYPSALRHLPSLKHVDHPTLRASLPFGVR